MKVVAWVVFFVCFFSWAHAKTEKDHADVKIGLLIAIFLAIMSAGAQ